MTNLKTMEQLEDQTTRAYDDTEFGALRKDDVLLAAWSPITAVDRLIAPVFVYQGVHDPITPNTRPTRSSPPRTCLTPTAARQPPPGVRSPHRKARADHPIRTRLSPRRSRAAHSGHE